MQRQPLGHPGVDAADRVLVLATLGGGAALAAVEEVVPAEPEPVVDAADDVVDEEAVEEESVEEEQN